MPLRAERQAWLQASPTGSSAGSSRQYGVSRPSLSAAHGQHAVVGPAVGRARDRDRAAGRHRHGSELRLCPDARSRAGRSCDRPSSSMPRCVCASTTTLPGWHQLGHLLDKRLEGGRRDSTLLSNRPGPPSGHQGADVLNEPLARRACARPWAASAMTSTQSARSIGGGVDQEVVEGGVACVGAVESGARRRGARGRSPRMRRSASQDGRCPAARIACRRRASAGAVQPHVEGPWVIAQHDRCGAAEDDAVAAVGPLEDVLLSSPLRKSRSPAGRGGGRPSTEGLADRRQESRAARASTPAGEPRHARSAEATERRRGARRPR